MFECVSGLLLLAIFRWYRVTLAKTALPVKFAEQQHCEFVEIPRLRDPRRLLIVQRHEFLRGGLPDFQWRLRIIDSREAAQKVDDFCKWTTHPTGFAPQMV